MPNRKPQVRVGMWLPVLARRPRWVLAGRLAALAVLGVYAGRVGYDHNLLHMQADGRPSKDTLTQFPTLGKALQYSRTVASFGTGLDAITIRAVDPSLAVPKAPPKAPPKPAPKSTPAPTAAPPTPKGSGPPARAKVPR